MRVPNHIAIILDGNGRWAKAKGMPRSYGHVKGCANLETICDDMKELGVRYLTVYAFSTENWKRSKEEVDSLMNLFRNYLKKCIKISRKNKMRVRVLGDISAFDEDIQQKVRELEEFSKDYDELFFQIALNYGGRDEIVRGIRKLAQDAADGKVSPEEITEEVFEGYLDTAGIPDPDFMIRTSGEQRLSNYHFARINQYTLINMLQIRSMEGDEIRMANGEKLYISSSRRKLFMEKYRQFAQENFSVV